jgi:hypothetical protein
MNYLTLQPFSRINEVWVSVDIDSRPADKSFTHPIIQGKSNSFNHRYQAQFYQHIALDIVTESVYNYPYPFVSEKTLRPIACKRLFIVVGAPGILQLLRDKNFVTFGDIIDESYDLETDHVLRWKKLEQAILNFVNQPLETIRNIVSDKSSVLEHNYQTLIHLEQTELKALHDPN